MAKKGVPAALAKFQFAKGGGRVGATKMAKPTKPAAKSTSKKSGKK